jgi:hypothetical protein
MEASLHVPQALPSVAQLPHWRRNLRAAWKPYGQSHNKIDAQLCIHDVTRPHFVQKLPLREYSPSGRRDAMPLSYRPCLGGAARTL